MSVEDDDIESITNPKTANTSGRISGNADVTLVKENEDGSAVYQFNFPPEAMEALTRLGIMTAIQAGIAEAKELSPDYSNDTKFIGDIKELAKKAGFVFWGDEEWRATPSIIDWSCDYDDELIRFYHLITAKISQDFPGKT